MARIEVKSEICKSCKLCFSACPKGLIGLGDKLNSKGYHYAVQHNPEKCTGCKFCAIMCPDAAINVYK